MKSQKIFHILDADTDINASISTDDDGSDPYIVISKPSHDAIISLTLADFRRLVASVNRQMD